MDIYNIRRKVEDWSGYTAYDYMLSQGENSGGFWDFWSVFRMWLRSRPVRKSCGFCRTKLWVLNDRYEKVYCSTSCELYGDYNQDCPDCKRPLYDGDHTKCVPF